MTDAKRLAQCDQALSECREDLLCNGFDELEKKFARLFRQVKAADEAGMSVVLESNGIAFLMGLAVVGIEKLRQEHLDETLR